VDLSRLLLAERLGGTLLQGLGAASLVIAERIVRHGAPQVLALSAKSEDLEEPLDSIGRLQAQGLDLNLVAVLAPVDGLPQAFRIHIRRLGSLVCALDAGTPWSATRPVLAKRLPGRLWIKQRVQLPPARLSPLELSQLRDLFPNWTQEQALAIFANPSWEPAGAGWTARWWPGVEVPEGAEILLPCLELPTATPVMEALRDALRASTHQPVPILPLDADPARLQALQVLGPEVQIFHGGPAAWSRAFLNLAKLPPPPHFCGRC
jgi:hypothetical protein